MLFLSLTAILTIVAGLEIVDLENARQTIPSVALAAHGAGSCAAVPLHVDWDMCFAYTSATYRQHDADVVFTRSEDRKLLSPGSESCFDHDALLRSLSSLLYKQPNLD